MELCEQLRQNEALAGVPVMFLSAGQIPDIIHRYDGRQGSYYLRKPFDPEVLGELIEQSIGCAAGSCGVDRRGKAEGGRGKDGRNRKRSASRFHPLSFILHPSAVRSGG